jgi:hypothetical protein
VLPDLLRPPPHRGPLIAAGAVVLALGILLEEIRLADEVALGGHLLILAAAAGLVLALGIQAPNEDGRPPAYQSVLLVTGLLLLYGALFRLADVLGAEYGGDFYSAGPFTWVSLLLAGVALWAALFRRSAICLLLAAIAAGIGLLSAYDLIFDPDTFSGARWLLLLLAIGLVVASLALRAEAPRHAELLVVGAGLAILAIGLQAVAAAVLDPFGSDETAVLPNLWELVLVVAGCGLVAYGALDRAPGPAWLGVANLAVFVFAVGLEGDATLYWWPFLLILLGAGGLAAGLRPRSPLPPEPDAYRAGEQPLASRTADDEVVLRVRDDSPPERGSVHDR